MSDTEEYPELVNYHPPSHFPSPRISDNNLSLRFTLHLSSPFGTHSFKTLSDTYLRRDCTLSIYPADYLFGDSKRAEHANHP